MPFQVVDTDEWHVPRSSEPLCVGQPYEYRSHQSGTASRCDNVRSLDASLMQASRDNSADFLNVTTAGKLGNDTAVGFMNGLAIDHVTSHARCVDNARSGLITAGLNA